MEVCNCPRCGKLFARINSAVCPDCEKEEGELFEKVRLYIKENPNSTLMKVSEETGASVRRIQRYIKEGRLEASRGMRDDILCEACGKPIPRGRYCGSCAVKVNRMVDDMFAEDKKSQANKVHISKGGF